MPLELHPMTESDMADMVRIQQIAFREGIASLLSTGPPTPESTQKDIEKNLKTFREEPDFHFLKVIDTDLDGKMIACAKWRINEKERDRKSVV